MKASFIREFSIVPMIVAPQRARVPTVKEINFAETVHIPQSIIDLESFQEWAHSDSYPEHGDVFWIDGVIWVDLHMDELDFHNAVKMEISQVLSTIVKEENLGYIYSDRARLVHREVGLSVEPDAVFISKETLHNGAIRRVPALGRGTRELEGTVDMVLEIVSDSSEKKDTIDLRHKYWLAGVLEYWLVDVRGDVIRFSILRRGTSGFVETRKADAWLRSTVFKHRFRLTMELDEDSIPIYTLNQS